MKKLFIVANWKSNKTNDENQQWFTRYKDVSPTIDQNEKIVIVCPPFHFIPKAKELVGNNQLAIFVGAQDVSPFEKGAYTGEVNATQLKEFVDYTIIGHSERRSNFSETDDMLAKKVAQAVAVGLQPIFCIQNAHTAIPEGVKIVAYEPVEAIGTGHADTPEDAAIVAKAVKENHPEVQAVLYGGSVTPENVNGFTSSPAIDGVLVGGASLDAEKFAQMITNS